MSMMDGAAVLRFEGDLDAQAVPACRRALNTVQRTRTARMVLDLESAKVGSQSIPLLAEIVRIAARHGAAVDLVGFPPVLRMALARTAPAPVRLFPAVDIALRTGPRDFRPGWRIGPGSGVQR